jgi:hypothetical protein
MATLEDDMNRQLTHALDARRFNDDLLSRVQAIEEILLDSGLTSKTNLGRKVKTIRKALSEKRAAEHLDLAKKLFQLAKSKRQRQLLEKASGPVQ